MSELLQPKGDWIERAKLGAKYGLRLGIVFSILAVVVFLVRQELPLRHAGVGLAAVLLLYLACGPISGAIVGLLLPLARSVPRAAFVGALSVLPLAFGARIALRGLGGWDRADLVVVAFLSLAVGGGTGALSRHLIDRSEALEQ